MGLYKLIIWYNLIKLWLWYQWMKLWYKLGCGFTSDIICTSTSVNDEEFIKEDYHSHKTVFFKKKKTPKRNENNVSMVSILRFQNWDLEVTCEHKWVCVFLLDLCIQLGLNLCLLRSHQAKWRTLCLRLFHHQISWPATPRSDLWGKANPIQGGAAQVIFVGVVPSPPI